MKVYIVGSVASGKTTLAKKLSLKSGIECIHLDSIVHIKDDSNKVWGNTRRSNEEIDRLFRNAISSSKWIVEDSGRKIFNDAIKESDCIIHLQPSVLIRKKRILMRYFKQKLGLEKALYTPNLRMLLQMYKWTRNFENGQDDLEIRLKSYKDKVIKLKTKNEVKRYLDKFELLKKS